MFSMLDGDALDAVVAKHKPDIIVPEIEAIRTERLYHLEQEGISSSAECPCSEFHDESQGHS